MSWLRSTLSKGRESVEVLKNVGTKATAAIATTAVTRARRLATGRGASSVELEAQLEKKARETKTAAGIQAMHKDWLQQIAAKESKSSSEAKERELSFKELLLQSRAIEISIEVLAVDAALREQYAAPPAPEDKDSPVATLYELLSKTLSCPQAHWAEVLRLAMGADGPLLDGHVAWVVGVVSAMKADWHEEALLSERRELALRAELLRQEINAIEGPAEGASPDDERCRRRVASSAELLQTYQAVRRNLEEAQSHRHDLFEEREKDLGLIVEQLQAHIVGLQSTASASTARHKHLEVELKQSQDSIQSQLQHMDDVRVQIDQELEQLEERKKQLRIELDNVSRELDEARQKQRAHMEKCDKQRSELAGVKTELKDKIVTEDAAARGAEQEQAVLERTQQLVRETGSLVQSALGTQLEELQKKQALFAEYFQDLLKEHLSYSEEQLRRLRARADAASTSEERGEAASAARAAEEAFGRFRTEHAETFSGIPEEVVITRLEGEFRAIVELVGAAPPADAAPPAGAAPAAAAPAAAAAAEAAPAVAAPAAGTAPFAPPPREAPESCSVPLLADDEGGPRPAGEEAVGADRAETALAAEAPDAAEQAAADDAAAPPAAAPEPSAADAPKSTGAEPAGGSPARALV